MKPETKTVHSSSVRKGNGDKCELCDKSQFGALIWNRVLCWHEEGGVIHRIEDVWLACPKCDGARYFPEDDQYE